MLPARSFRFFLIAVLSMTELMPVAFVSSAMPVLLRRSGASMSELGFLSLVMIPWSIKALWAPVVDKFGARSRLGRYRGWLFITHPLLLMTLVVGASTDVPSLLFQNRSIGLPALFWLTFVAATADTASHGLAVLLLRPEERGIGAGIQSIGMSAGALLGGGLMIMMVESVGWRIPLLLMAGAILLPLTAITFYREPPVDTAQALTLGEAASFFRQPHLGPWLAVSSILTLLSVLPAVPFQALFVDHGMSLTEIGFILGILSSVVGALGGGIGGSVVRLLGRKRAFYLLHGLCILCLSGAAFIVTRAQPGRYLLYCSAALASFALAVVGTILRVMIMDRCRPHLASTDYTIQASILGLITFIGSGLGGVLAGRLGAVAVFLFVPPAMLAFLAAVPRLLPAKTFEAEPQR